jgi:hypothetical protein
MIIKLCNKDVSKGKEDGYGCKFLHATGHQCSLITRSITFFEHQALTYALMAKRKRILAFLSQTQISFLLG